MRIALRRAVALCVLSFVTIAGIAQQVPLTPQELAIKAQVDKLPPQAPIHLKLRHAPDQFGTFVSSDQQGLVIYNLYADQNIPLAYADVQTIKNGFGSYNPNTGKKSHKRLIITLVIIAIAILSGYAGLFRD